MAALGSKGIEVGSLNVANIEYVLNVGIDGGSILGGVGWNRLDDITVGSNLVRTFDGKVGPKV